MIKANYVTIQGWQREVLGLSGSDLIAFALIFGFCQAKNKARFSLGYLGEWLGTSKKTTISILKRLEAGKLIKADRRPGKLTSYRVNAAYVAQKLEESDHATGVETTPQRCRNYTTTGVETTPDTSSSNYPDNEVIERTLEMARRCFGNE